MPAAKDKTGKVIDKLKKKSPFEFMLETCISNRHRVQWGPRCRVMKRKPAGRENVSLVCKTCGNYIEYSQEEVNASELTRKRG